ncbi:MAG: hypothetical protein JEZ12_18270 [Desulfobacterium sp.]|nr:hypothetical protein [Desulfobacterium sp.]
MKVITELFLRESFKTSVPESFCLGAGQIMTPSAAQFLGEKQVALVRAGDKAPSPAPAEQEGAAASTGATAAKTDQDSPPGYETRTRYRSASDGGVFEKKPEHMTQLHGKLLVPKDHPRIYLRGKLDSLQSFTLLLQHGADQAGLTGLVEDLGEVLSWEREILKAEVLDQPLKQATILGFTDPELRERSHNPKKFFKTGHILPALGMDPMILKLNKLRSDVREVELAAVKAFKGEFQVEKTDLLQALNRMSSAVYIMMLKFKAGLYN